MLGEHFGSVEHTSIVELSFHQNTLTFTKQIRQNPRVAHREIRALMIRQHKGHTQILGAANHAALHNHATCPQSLAYGCFAGDNILRQIKHIHVLAGDLYQQGGNTARHQKQKHRQIKALFAFRVHRRLQISMFDALALALPPARKFLLAR